MKKIFFISIVSFTIGFFTSCTADDIAEQTSAVVADDTGGQHGFPPPPPPPPKPGTEP